MDNWVIRGICGVMDLVFHLSLLVFSGTLELTGTPVAIVVDVALYVLLCIARSVI